MRLGGDFIASIFAVACWLSMVSIIRFFVFATMPPSPQNPWYFAQSML